jgi:putative restriction endonuclease
MAMPPSARILASPYIGLVTAEVKRDRMAQPTVVANTDNRWYDFLSASAVDGRLDEVNFWRPLAQGEFRALEPGQPFFFRLKHRISAIAGYGYFAHATRVPIQLAWDAFGQRNGDPTFESFLNRIADYRHESPMETLLGQRELTCLVLRESQFLPKAQWFPWGEAEDWHPNVVAFKGYDLARGVGQKLAQMLANGRPQELTANYDPYLTDMRRLSMQELAIRDGQGAFRLRVLDAYDRRYAVTGEHSLPVLDAAHITPYLGPKSNHIQNGLVLRADIHRLFDGGYVTVTPDYRFKVSTRLKDEFDNGAFYYSLADQPLKVIPSDLSKHPSREALEWHASELFH